LQNTSSTETSHKNRFMYALKGNVIVEFAWGQRKLNYLLNLQDSSKYHILKGRSAREKGWWKRSRKVDYLTEAKLWNPDGDHSDQAWETFISSWDDRGVAHLMNSMHKFKRKAENRRTPENLMKEKDKIVQICLQWRAIWFEFTHSLPIIEIQSKRVSQWKLFQHHNFITPTANVTK